MAKKRKPRVVWVPEGITGALLWLRATENKPKSGDYGLYHCFVESPMSAIRLTYYKMKCDRCDDEHIACKTETDARGCAERLAGWKYIDGKDYCKRCAKVKARKKR